MVLGAYKGQSGSGDGENSRVFTYQSINIQHNSAKHRSSSSIAILLTKTSKKIKDPGAKHHSMVSSTPIPMPDPQSKPDAQSIPKTKLTRQYPCHMSSSTISSTHYTPIRPSHHLKTPPCPASSSPPEIHSDPDRHSSPWHSSSAHSYPS